MPEHNQPAKLLSKPWAFFSATMFVVCFLLSSIVPPLQSPDEFDHLKRAYLLSKGQIILDTPTGQSSGGMIDTGMSSYLDFYRRLPFHPEKKLSADELAEVTGLKWSGEKKFSGAPGTGFYFPLVYTPQAVGLAIGETLGLTVDTSYRLARLSALIASTLLLLLSFSIYRPTFLAALLLILPMSLFQFTSASLDGISTALFVLAISCFSRIATDKKAAHSTFSYLLIACVVLITSSRVHALPIFLLVFVSYFYTKNKRTLIVGAAALLAVIAWLAIAIKFTHDTRFKDATPTSSIIVYYLKDPIALIKVVYRTLENPGTVKGYLQSFAGILGWLDTKFSSWIYTTIYAFCIIITLLSFPFNKLKSNRILRLTLIISGAGSIALIFIALLITWTASEHPAVTIQGIQGRYFMIPALLIAYALCSEQEITNKTVRQFGFAVLFIFFMFSAYSTSKVMISRYYLTGEKQQQTNSSVTPSAPISDSQPARLIFDKELQSAPIALQSIGVMFGTYMRSNQGVGELVLRTKDGTESSVKFDFSALGDNEYKRIELDGKAYSSGEIRAETGGGVSVWETTTDEGIASCLIYEFTNGAKRYTKGCPRP